MQQQTYTRKCHTNEGCAGIVTKLFSKEKWEPDEYTLVGAEADAAGRLTVQKFGQAAWRVAGVTFPRMPTHFEKEPRFGTHEIAWTSPATLDGPVAPNQSHILRVLFTFLRRTERLGTGKVVEEWCTLWRFLLHLCHLRRVSQTNAEEG